MQHYDMLIRQAAYRRQELLHQAEKARLASQLRQRTRRIYQTLLLLIQMYR